LGKFEQVSGGTIFLDEIGDMSIATQAKVLRLLQEQRFERVGANETIRTDVRVIAATNKDLAALVDAGRFRQDLFYRLNGFTISLPPLRQRREDLPVLTRHLIHGFNRELGKQVRSLTPEAEAMLTAHDWPGNVRELQSAIKYAMLHASGETITDDNLPDTCKTRGASEADPTADLVEIEAVASPWPAAKPAPAAGSEPELQDLSRLVHELLENHAVDVYRQVGLTVDRVVLNVVLQHVRGNQLQAAELLGISRTTLRTKLRALGMTVEKQLVADDR
jgi:two-component system nitrogen regulation response regulator GlnG